MKHAIGSAQNGGHLDYWKKRSNMLYYQYVEFLVRGLASDAKSLIDVGSSNAEYIEKFDWIPKRNTLDIVKPYSSENVEGIQIDFFEFDPEEKYDFATCLQVLEHIPDAKLFAKKLFDIADRVLISVPYLWEENSSEDHVHDPVDLNKLREWTDRDPSYYIVVKEPLFESFKSKRLICYYHPENEKFNIKKARRNSFAISISSAQKEESLMQKLNETLMKQSEETSINHQVIHHRLEEVETKIDKVSNELAKNIAESKRINNQLLESINALKIQNQSIQSQLKLRELQKELHNRIERNNKLTKELAKLKSDLKQLNDKKEQVELKIKKFESLYKQITSSRSWRYTKYLRKFMNSIRAAK